MTRCTETAEERDTTTDEPDTLHKTYEAQKIKNGQGKLKCRRERDVPTPTRKVNPQPFLFMLVVLLLFPAPLVGAVFSPPPLGGVAFFFCSSWWCFFFFPSFGCWGFYPLFGWVVLLGLLLLLGGVAVQNQKRKDACSFPK